MKKYVLALDQGTTSSRAIVFDREGKIVAKSQHDFTQIYPKPGWVEHDPLEIWGTQRMVASQALRECGLASEIAGIGITNQRETTIVWEKATGKPIYNAIVWQCRRTADICDTLIREHHGVSELVAEKTGLLIDAYFSGTKIRWILDNVPGVRARAEKGELLFGTVETWLIWRLT
ncbi:MAG: glycerol kinase, partial [Ruminococcaceae bacterium]|nr:glycerol kinase [Oscillospiraceae bacterium]